MLALCHNMHVPKAVLQGLNAYINIMVSLNKVDTISLILFIMTGRQYSYLNRIMIPVILSPLMETKLKIKVTQVVDNLTRSLKKRKIILKSGPYSHLALMLYMYWTFFINVGNMSYTPPLVEIYGTFYISGTFHHVHKRPQI